MTDEEEERWKKPGQKKNRVSTIMPKPWIFLVKWKTILVVPSLNLRFFRKLIFFFQDTLFVFIK